MVLTKTTDFLELLEVFVAEKRGFAETSDLFSPAYFAYTDRFNEEQTQRYMELQVESLTSANL